MEARKQELVEKKRRLAELKRQRELRQEQIAQRQSLGTASPGKSIEERRTEIDNLVSNLIDRQRDSHGPQNGSRPSSVYGANDAASQNGAEPTAPRRQMASVSTQTTSTDPVPTATIETHLPAVENPIKKVEYITYAKGTQTEPYVDSGTGPDGESDEQPSPRRRKRISRVEREQDEQIREKLRKEIEDELKATQDGTGAGEASETRQRFPLRQLTDNELNAVTSSNDFLHFIERSSRVIERALDEEYDLLADYTRASSQNKDDDDPYRSTKKAHSMRETMQLFSDRYTRRRMVTDLNFSPHFSELLLTSYTKNPSAPNEPAGLVLLWNTHAPSRPEYVFTAGTDVLCARFSPFHPNLVIGGCYSGQVCLWDTRTSGRNGQPVQKTPQSGSHMGHTHPVYNVSVVGTPNAHNILTSSMDGVVCSWSVDMLTQAQEFLELSTPPPTRTDDLAPTAMTFPSSDPTFFLVGTEEGSIYPCHRYDRAGSKAGVDSRVKYRGHTAPVMSAQFHPGRGPVDLGDLMLSSSSDWSIKMWRVKPAATSSTAATTTTTSGGAVITNGTDSSNKQDVPPILDIQTEDLVYSTQWHPTRPSIFASCLGNGELQVYDLLSDIEVPVARAQPNRGRNGVTPFRGLNKLAWEERSGRFAATGGLDGIVTIFEMSRGLRGETSEVTQDEWLGMKRLVSRLESGGVVTNAVL